LSGHEIATRTEEEEKLGGIRSIVTGVDMVRSMGVQNETESACNQVINPLAKSSLRQHCPRPAKSEAAPEGRPAP